MKKIVIAGLLVLGMAATCHAEATTGIISGNRQAGTAVVRDGNGDRVYVSYGPGYINVWRPGEIEQTAPRQQRNDEVGQLNWGRRLIDDVLRGGK